MKNCVNHPERRVHANGMCRPCYDQHRWSSLSNEQKRDKIYKCDYGLTLKEVEGIHASQNFRCAACDDIVELGFNKGVVDHCHTSNKVRGILCSPCNTALGFVFDDINRLKGLIKYLEERQ